MMIFVATQVGGGVILGAADEAFLFGWPVLLYPLGASLGLILLECGTGILTMIVCIVPVFFGSLANSMNLEIPQGGSVLMTAIAKTTTPWITALVGCAILAAIISTATSLINAISSNLSNDFNLTSFSKIDPMRIVKGITSTISMEAIFFAFYLDNIVDLLIQSYELAVSALFIPVLIALFKKQGNSVAALLAMIFGILGFFLFRVYPMNFPKEIANILLSLFGYLCGEVVVLYRSKTSTHDGHLLNREV